MIKALAPLGATHVIVLTLAYGELPKAAEGSELPLEGAPPPGEASRHVTVTAVLKSKGDGETRTLQFKGPAAEVEQELAAQLPQVVTKLVTHQNDLAALDAQLEEEKRKAKEAQQEKDREAGKVTTTDTSGKKSTTRYPSTSSASKKPAAETPAKPEATKESGAEPTAAAKAVAAAASKAAAKARGKGTTPAAEPTPAPAAETPAAPAATTPEPSPAPETTSAPAIDPALATLAAGLDEDVAL